MIKRFVIKLILAISTPMLASFLGGSSTHATNIQDSPYVPSGYTYKWGDEFDGDSVDLTKWSNYWEPDYRGMIPDDRGNQYVRNGALHLVTSYESGKIIRPNIVTQMQGGYHDSNNSEAVHGAVKYGYIEARIKTRLDNAATPSFWMMSNTKLPDRQTANWYMETDIMEGQNYPPITPPIQASHQHKWGSSRLSNRYHTMISGAPKVFTSDGADGTTWVTYGLLWTPETMETYVNGRLTTKISLKDNEAFDRNVTVGKYAQYYGMGAFHDPAYLILASGARKESGLVDTSKLPIETQFDYVRVYQKQGEGKIYNEPHVITTTLKPGVLNRGYSDAIVSTSQPVEDNHFSITDGRLPDGLGIEGNTGTISGTPTKPGQYSFTVTVTNNQFPGKSDSRKLTIEVDSGGENNNVGHGHMFILAAPNTGVKQPYLIVASGQIIVSMLK